MTHIYARKNDSVPILAFSGSTLSQFSTNSDLTLTPAVRPRRITINGTHCEEEIEYLTQQLHRAAQRQFHNQRATLTNSQEAKLHEMTVGPLGEHLRSEEINEWRDILSKPIMCDYANQKSQPTTKQASKMALGHIMTTIDKMSKSRMINQDCKHVRKGDVVMGICERLKQPDMVDFANQQVQLPEAESLAFGQATLCAKVERLSNQDALTQLDSELDKMFNSLARLNFKSQAFEEQRYIPKTFVVTT